MFVFLQVESIVIAKPGEQSVLDWVCINAFIRKETSIILN